MTEEGAWAFDCQTKEMVLTRACVLALLGDNPMQSEFACHIGLRGKLYCRICKVDGNIALDDDSRHNDTGVHTSDSDSTTDQGNEAQGTTRRTVSGVLSSTNSPESRGRGRTSVPPMEQLLNRAKKAIQVQ